MWRCNLELNILNAIQMIRNPILDKLFLSITSLGNAGLIWIILCVAFLLTKRYRRIGVTMLISLVLCLVFGNIILKNAIKRPRPSWINKDIVLLIKNPKDYSFPSGHTLSSFAAAMSIYINKKNFGKIAFILAILISFSRLYLYVHYPTDVLFGAALGIFLANIANTLYLDMEKRKKKRII